MSQAISLDHVGIVGHDLPALAEAFAKLGFTLTPRAAHAGGRTGNHCVMLRDGGYLELLSVIDGGISATLDRFLARHAGAHILALGIDNPAANQARLGQAVSMSQTDRLIDASEPNGPSARFTLLTPPDPDWGRTHLVHHETPAALWQDRFCTHPNHAVALCDVTLRAPEPARAAAFLSLLAGRLVVPDPVGGYALVLPRGRVRIQSGAIAKLAAITMRTDDENTALRGILGAGEIPHQDDGQAVTVEAGGVVLRFVG